MALNSSIAEFLNIINQNPVYMVFGVAFGMPLFMFIYGITLGRLFRKSFFSKVLNTILFTTFGGVWIMGFILMMILFFIGVSGIKLFFSTLLLFLFVLTFVVVNYKTVNKFIDEQMIMITEKSKK